MEEKEEILARVKMLIREELSTFRFDSWIKPVGIVSIEDNNVCLLAVSDLQKVKLTNEYMTLVEAAFTTVLGKPVNIDIVVEKLSNVS